MNHLRLCSLVGFDTMEQFASVQHEDYTTMIWFAALIWTFLGTSKVDGVESRIFITPQLSDPMQSNIFSTNILQYLLRTNKTDEKKPKSQTAPTITHNRIINHSDNVDDDMKSATALLEDVWLPKINNLSKTSEVFKETYNKTSIDYIINIKKEINIIDNKTVSDDEKHDKNKTKGTNIMSINKFGIKDPNKLFENNVFKNNSNSNVINSEPSYKLLLDNQTDKNATLHEHNINSDPNTGNITFYTAINNNNFKLLQENKTEKKACKPNNSEHNTSEKTEILERRLEKKLNNINIIQNPQMLEIMKTITNSNKTQSFTAETNNNNNNTSNTPRLLYFLNEEEAPKNNLSLSINTNNKLDTVSETEPRKRHKVCVNNLQNQTENASTVPLYSMFEKMNPKIKVPSPLDSSELDKSTETQYTRRKNLNHLNDSSEISSSDLPFSYRGNVLTLDEYLSSLLKNNDFQRINNSLILDKINGTDVLKKVTVYKNSGNHGEVSKVNSTDKNNITVNKCNTNSQTITVNNILTSNKVNVNFIVPQEVWKGLIKKFNNNSAHSKENNEKSVHVSYKEPEYTFTLRNITNDAFFENEFFYNNIDDDNNNNNNNNYNNNNNNTNINNNNVNNNNNTNTNNGIKNNSNNNNYDGNNNSNNNNIRNNNGSINNNNNNNNINKNNNNNKDNNNNFDNSKNNNNKNKDGNTNFGNNKNNKSKNKDNNNYFKNSKNNRSHNKNNNYYFRNSKTNGKKSKDNNNKNNTNKYEVEDDVDDDVGNDNNNNRGKNNNENTNINNVDIATKNITDTLLFKSSYYNNVTNSKSNLKVYVANIQDNKKNKLRTLVNRKLKAYSHREIENPPLNIISNDLPKSVILSQKNNIKIFPTNVSLSPEITKAILQTIVNKTTHYATIPILNKQLVNSETNNILKIPNKYSRVVKDTTNDTIIGNQDDSSKNLFFEFIKNNEKFNSLIENNHIKKFSDNLYCLFFDNNICDYKLYFVYNQTVSKCSSVNYARLIFKSNKNKHLNLIITKYKLAKPFLFLNNTLINNQKRFYMNYAEPKIILVKSLIESNMSLFICNFKNNTFKPVPNKDLLKYINQFLFKPKFVYKRNRSIDRPILKTKDVNTTFKSNADLTNLHGNAKSHHLSSVTKNVSETILKIKNNVTDVNYGNSMPVTVKKTRIITRKYINNQNKNKKLNNYDYYIKSKSHMHSENNSNTTGCKIDKESANVTVELHNKNLTTLTISDINKLLDKYFPDNNITITSNSSSQQKNAQIRNIFNIILNEILKTNPKFNYTKDFLELANSLNITDNTSFINNSRILNSKSFINDTNLNNSINYLIDLINESKHISPYIQYVIETQIENCKRRKGIINGTFEDSRQSIFDNLRSINLCMNRFFNISMKNFKLWLNYTKRHLKPNFKIYEEFERFYRHRYKFFAMRTRNSTKSNNVTTAGIKEKNVIPYIKSNSFNATNHNKTTKVLNNPQINTIKEARINGTRKPGNNLKHKYYLQRHALKSNITDYNRHNKSSLNKPNIYKSNTKGVHKSNVKYSYRYPLLQKNLKHEKEKSYTELKQKHITKLKKMRCLKKKNNLNHFSNQTVYAKNMIVKNI